MKDHLLIMRFSALGDVAMTVPVVYSLAQQYPDLRITVLSRSFARSFYENLAPNVSFMEADLKGENKGIRGLNRFFRRLKAKNFTHVADMHDVLRSKYLRLCFLFTPTKVRHINKHRREKRQLTAKENKNFQHIPTSFDNYNDVLKRLGYPVRLNFHSIFPPSGGDLSLLPTAIGPKKAEERWIGIAPFAAHKGKILPLEKTEEIISELNKHDNLRIMLFSGGKEERKTVEDWCRRYACCTNASAQSASLMHELIVMSHLDVMMSMDSANMHLASLVGTPVVSIWGATHPAAGFMGWNQSIDNAIQLPMECRPCSIYGNKPCLRGDYACLNNISAADIVSKIDEITRTRQ